MTFDARKLGEGPDHTGPDTRRHPDARDPRQVDLRCAGCGHEWVGVHPDDRIGTGRVLCPDCQTRTGPVYVDGPGPEPEESPSDGADEPPSDEPDEPDRETDNHTRPDGDLMEWEWGDSDTDNTEPMDCNHDNTEPIPEGESFMTETGLTGTTDPGDEWCPSCESIITADGEVIR